MNIIDGQARDAFVITKADGASLPQEPIAVYVGGTGNITLITEAEYDRRRLDNAALNDAAIIALCSTVLFSALPVGFVLNLRIKAILSTGTTATLLVGYLP